MIKAIFVDLLIVVAIMFIYPLESIIMPIGMSIFSNSSSDKDLIKGFGNVRIENYKKYEKIGNYKNFIFWSYELENYRKTNWWSRTINTSISNALTIRTANTIKKIVELGK